MERLSTRDCSLQLKAQEEIEATGQSLVCRLLMFFLLSSMPMGRLVSIILEEHLPVDITRITSPSRNSRSSGWVASKLKSATTWLPSLSCGSVVWSLASDFSLPLGSSGEPWSPWNNKGPVSFPAFLASEHWTLLKPSVKCQGSTWDINCDQCQHTPNMDFMKAGWLIHETKRSVRPYIYS